MARNPLLLPPGLSRNATEYATRGRWWDADRARFRKGYGQSIGGWQASSITGTPSGVDGVARSMLAYRHSVEVAKYMAIGTHKGLFVYNDDTITDITPALFPEGRVSSAPGRGYGVGPYGAETYGTPRTGSATSFILDPTFWWLDTWGDELVCLASHDGTIYAWDGDLAGPAVAIAGASVPINNKGLLVTEERHLVAWGCDGDPRRLQFSDEEDYSEWTPNALTKAGGRNFVGVTKIMSALRTRGAILLWTDNALWTMVYQGAPFYYGIERVGIDCGPIGVRSMTARLAYAYWMGRDSFFIWNGSVQKLPCEVEGYVFKILNRAHQDKVFAFLNEEFSEIWWLLPVGASTEPNFYVIYNYEEDTWSFGFLSRTAWHPRNAAFDRPIAVSEGGAIYDHETGETDDGADLGFRLESGPSELGEGERTMRLSAIIPDSEQAGNVNLTVETRQHPKGPATSHGPYLIEPTTERIPVRIAGRQARMIIEGTAPESFVRLGRFRADFGEAGPR